MIMRRRYYGDTDNPPGQVVNTLSDYIGKIKEDIIREDAKDKPKLSFEDWFDEFSNKYSLDDRDSLGQDFLRCWRAAQENKP